MWPVSATSSKPLDLATSDAPDGSNFVILRNGTNFVILKFCNSENSRVQAWKRPFWKLQQVVLEIWFVSHALQFRNDLADMQVRVRTEVNRRGDPITKSQWNLEHMILHTKWQMSSGVVPGYEGCFGYLVRKGASKDKPAKFPKAMEEWVKARNLEYLTNCLARVFRA